MTVPAECGLTILRTIGFQRATKRWNWDAKLNQWSKTSYTAGSKFETEQCRFSRLTGLVKVLERVQADPRAFVVRGALIPDAVAAVADNPFHRIRRRKNGDSASLIEVSRQWIMVDIDGWPLPTWGDLADDPDTVIDHAIHDLLPPAFHDAVCWWQLSSSAGFVPGFLKAHLFFWLSEPATNDHIKTVFKQHAPSIDRAVFNAAQVHYIAAPIITGGHDPIPHRTGWRKGLEIEVVLPAILPPAPRKAFKKGNGKPSNRIDEALDVLGHGEGGEGFHAPLRTATYRYAQQCARYNERDDEKIKAYLRDRIRSAPCRPGSDVERPYCQDYYLDPMINGAFAKISGSPEIQSMTPQHTAPTGDAADARKKLAHYIGQFIHHVATRTEDEEAQHAALVVGTGLGKTTIAREALPAFFVQTKAAGKRMLWCVPNHQLGNQTLSKMQELGLNVAVWRGRDAENPDAPIVAGEEQQKMCVNMPAVLDAVAAAHDVEAAACGSSEPGAPCCPFRSRCAYQKQKPVVAAADVVIAAHEFMFHRLPKVVSDGLASAIVDESWWQKGIRTDVETVLSTFSEVVLTYPVQKLVRTGKKTFFSRVDEAATKELHGLSTKAYAVLRGLQDGEFLSRAAVEEVGLVVDDCTRAISFEWDRLRKGLIFPGQTEDQRKKALQAAAGNRGISSRVSIWQAMRELLEGDATHTGRLTVGMSEESATRVVLWNGFLQVREGIAKLPVLLLDATMPVSTVRKYLPRLDVLAEVHASAPHMSITQVVGPWGKTSLVPHHLASQEENRRRERLLGELQDFVQANSGGDGLVISYKDIEHFFKNIPGVRVLHFNATVGLDDYKDVKRIFIIGRPLPKPKDVRAMAIALSGQPIAEETPQLQTRGVLMSDGTGAAMNVRCYEHPELEAVRSAVTDADLVQNVGRGRGVNRTAQNPLHVYVMADVILPFPVQTIVRWSDVRLNDMQRMAARGVYFTQPTDAQRRYEDLFPTVEAARKAFQRAEVLDICLYKKEEGGSLLGECPVPRAKQVSYKPVGAGQRARVAYARTDQVEPLREWLESTFSGLARFDVTDVHGAEQDAVAPAEDVPADHGSTDGNVEMKVVGPFSLWHPEPKPVAPWQPPEWMQDHLLHQLRVAEAARRVRNGSG